MPSPVQSITRAATRRPDEKLNILTCCTHEAYETNMVRTNHNFYAWRAEGIKDWDFKYRPLPNNYTLLTPQKGNQQLYLDIDVDLVLSQNHAGQFQVLSQIASFLHVPVVSITHTLPMPNWDVRVLAEIKKMRGDINLFISEYSRNKWGWNEDEAEVIHHGIDTELFNLGNKERKPHILSVVNDWINRDWCCGFRPWQQVTQNLPVRPVGNTPGLSQPAASLADLVNEYQTSQIFINTSTVSPVPTAMLEAMACGCAIVSLSNCMIPEIITHGQNGFLTNNLAEMRQILEHLLKRPEYCRQLGENARQTILEKFALARFINQWNDVFNRAANTVFKR